MDSEKEEISIEDPQQAAAVVKQLKYEDQQIVAKINELEAELNEHVLVLETLGKTDSARKCFRLIGGVLVERTVAEVAPAVEKNKEGIQSVIQSLYHDHKLVETQMLDLTSKFKLNPQTKGQQTPQPEEQAEKKDSEKQSGILV